MSNSSSNIKKLENFINETEVAITDIEKISDPEAYSIFPISRRNSPTTNVYWPEVKENMKSLAKEAEKLKPLAGFPIDERWISKDPSDEEERLFDERDPHLQKIANKFQGWYYRNSGPKEVFSLKYRKLKLVILTDEFKGFEKITKQVSKARSYAETILTINNKVDDQIESLKGSLKEIMSFHDQEFKEIFTLGSKRNKEDLHFIHYKQDAYLDVTRKLWKYKDKTEQETSILGKLKDLQTNILHGDDDIYIEFDNLIKSVDGDTNIYDHPEISKCVDDVLTSRKISVDKAQAIIAKLPPILKALASSDNDQE